MSKAFKEMTELDPNSVLIVDSLNLSFRWKHSKAKIFAEDFIETVRSLARSYKCGKIILTCDQGSSSYRKNIYPEYKANRAEKYANQTEQEAKDFEIFIKEFNRTMELAAEHFPLFKYNNVEADDIAAYLVSKLKNTHNIWLISSDKDWELLIDTNVSKFSYTTRKETTLNNWSEHHECTPEEYISIKCLQGDTGDNIKGIEGIGPKRALDLVKQYGSAFDIHAAIPISSKYKFITALNNSGDTILTNYKLMDLVTYCEEAIGEENIRNINERLENVIDNKY
jgi:5'-3' exonuclease